MRFNLFGERVLVKKVEVKQGTIYIPEAVRANAIHKIGEVVAVGNGIYPGQEKVHDMIVKPGDIVFFQTNAVLAANCCFEYLEGDKTENLLNMHQGDCVARLDDNDPTFDKFHPLGTLVLPDKMDNDRTFVYYKVAKMGTKTALDLKPGQEVVIAHGHANVFMLDRKEYVYIPEHDIHGVVVTDDPA